MFVTSSVHQHTKLLNKEDTIRLLWMNGIIIYVNLQKGKYKCVFKVNCNVFKDKLIKLLFRSGSDF